MEIDIEKIIANMPKDVILNIMRNNVEKNCETMFKLSYNWRNNIRQPTRRLIMPIICSSNILLI